MGRLYTIVAEHRGGTYISQIEADSPRAAVQRWTEMQPSEKQDVPINARLELRKQLSAGDALVALAGLNNVWSISGTHRNQLILVNVVLTWSS